MNKISNIHRKIRINKFHYSKNLVNMISEIKGKYKTNTINAFWWSNVLNFGDLLTPSMIKYYGYTPVESKMNQSKLIGVGSILGKVPSDYTGVILGSGLINNEYYPIPSNATFAAVRGELTKSALQLSNNVVTGDLGLISDKLITRPIKKKYNIGFIPHYVDLKNPWFNYMSQKYRKNCCIIDVQDSPKNVIAQIANCELIVSSSLHGIIVADSLSIPNVWIQLSNKVIGDGFKFYDYNSSIDYEQHRIHISHATQDLDFDSIMSNKNQQKILDKKNELEKVVINVLQKISKL